MKRILSVLLLSLAIASPVVLRADDHPHKQKKCPPDVASIVTDLSAAQKKKIEQISKEGKERINQLEGLQRQVRDSIRMYMDKYEDNSKILYPLFDREGKIETDINKEKYRIKTAINKILTPDQHKQLVEHFRKTHKHEKCDKACDKKLDKGMRVIDQKMPAKKSAKQQPSVKQ
ncbi:MAG: hypothetical protein IJT39_05705 [Bacteroidales bacterium]|nr:hypothetical protein [Bacteroidales bacterium]